ncbi:MAG: invasion associated locus B family protein [Roseobacter sp.]|jgi:invasion protein IalB|nr:invasion associated locus B family protein [Roseobacter sp.]
MRFAAPCVLFIPQVGLAELPPTPDPQDMVVEVAAADPRQITVQVFEAWRVSCGGAEADSCRVWQRVQVVVGDVAQDVMSVSLAPSEGTGGLVLVIQTPSDVYLPADFALRIDRGRERRARFRNCNAAGCWVVMPVDADLLRDLRRGLEAQAAFSLVEGETVRISFSLRGMTEALAAYEAERAARG